MNKYQNIGYLNRHEYLDTLSMRYNIEKEIVYEIADILGENEDFDGLFGLLNDYNALADTETLYNLWNDITDYKEDSQNRTYYLTPTQIHNNYGKIKPYKDRVPKSTCNYNKSITKKYKNIIKYRNGNLSGLKFEYPMVDIR